MTFTQDVRATAKIQTHTHAHTHSCTRFFCISKSPRVSLCSSPSSRCSTHVIFAAVFLSWSENGRAHFPHLQHLIYSPLAHTHTQTIAALLLMHMRHFAYVSNNSSSTLSLCFALPCPSPAPVDCILAQLLLAQLPLQISNIFFFCFFLSFRCLISVFVQLATSSTSCATALWLHFFLAKIGK